MVLFSKINRPTKILPLPHIIPKSYKPKAVLVEKRKLLESQLVGILDSCITFIHIKQVHAQIIRNGFDQCCFVITKLLRMLTKLGVPMYTYPTVIFTQVCFPNPFLYTALIRGYSVQGMVEKSVSLYGEMMRHGVGASSFTFTAFLKHCGRELDVGLGGQIHGQSLKIGGFAQDLLVGNALIDMYVKCGALADARRAFDEMPTRDVISFTTLIVAYAKVGDMAAASELFERVPMKDMVAWTSMVTGYAQNAQPRKALEFFEKMQNAQVRADEVTLSSVISACAQLGGIKSANWVRSVAETSGFGAAYDVVLGSALIDMYSKCGSLNDAYNIFESMKNKNVFSYSSMILGFAIHGCAREAIELFEEMVKTDIKPNKVTFIGVLSACSHAGLVEQGRYIFGMMDKCYGVTPSEEHHTCMVDLLGKTGRLEEAIDLIQTMAIEPNASIWGALLGACRIHKNPEVAEMAARHLFELEPNITGNYVLLSNIYASAGRWTDVSRVRKLMRGKGLAKPPSISIVEDEKGEIHEFYADDMSHPNYREIKQEVKNLVNRLEVVGYRPNLSCVPYDVDDGEKERILLAHSEKLALAYMLVTTNDGCPIRIIKNLRICEDCHSVMTKASELAGRVIVVRDKIRFHHFSNGKCSCGNFW